jgi:AcrR family transcriptional regulator
VGRPPRFPAEAILDSARDLTLREGVGGLTMSAVAADLGAPSGSVYHRFASREHLAAALWLRTVERFQSGFIAALAAHDNPVEAAVSAARWVVDWAAAHPADASLLTRYRSEDLIRGDYPEQVRHRAEEAKAQLGHALAGVAQRLGQPVDLVVFAVVQIPYAAVREFAGSGRPLPAWTGDAVARATRAALPPRTRPRVRG